MSVAHLADVDAIARLAHELLRSAGGPGRGAQALRLIRAVRAVALPVAGEGGGDAGSVAAGELVAAAGVVGAVQLVAAVAAVVHAIAAGGGRTNPSRLSQVTGPAK